MLQHRNNIKSQGEGWLLCNACFFLPAQLHRDIFSDGLILAVLRDEPATADTIGEESGTPSMFSECRSHMLWPSIILHIISTHNLLTVFYAEGLNRRKTRQKTYWAILWARPILCVFYFYFFLLFSFYSSLFLPAKANKLYQQIQLSDTRPRSIRPETNFGRQQWKKKESGQFSGER